MTWPVSDRAAGAKRTIQLAALLLAVAAPAAAQQAAEKIFRDARAYTVRVRTQIDRPFAEDARGSFGGAGFLIDAQRGWILTNAHVVGQSPSTVSLAFADEEYQSARKIYVDSFADLAVLAIPGPIRGRRAAAIACDAEPPVGEAVGVFGHPLGIPFTGSRGIISGKTDQFGSSLLQTDATIDCGNSGGPVIRLRDERVIGIATAGAGGDRADRLNFATPMKDVCRVLDLLRRGERPEPPRLGVALLMDEDDDCTMRVGAVLDPERWPLRPGDAIKAVAGVQDQLRTVSDVIRELRGRRGRIPLVVEREGTSITIEVEPSYEPPIIARRAVVVDGALIAPAEFQDGSALSERPSLAVQSVDPGSDAETLRLECMDLIVSIDGRPMGSLEALIDHLRQREAGSPLQVVFRRGNGSCRSLFEYHVRELPGKTVEILGPEPNSVSIAAE